MQIEILNLYLCMKRVFCNLYILKKEQNKVHKESGLTKGSKKEIILRNVGASFECCIVCLVGLLLLYLKLLQENCEIFKIKNLV